MLKKFPARLDELHSMMDLISTHAEELGFTREDLGRIQIASEEALVNVIHYAYPSDEEGDLELGCSHLNGKMLEIVLKDRGVPFNPLKDGEEVNTLATAEERRIGGLGVMMIQQMMDHVEYERKDDCNVLKMRKSLST